MAFLRSVLHMLVMVLTVVPYTLAILLVRLVGGSSALRYRIARAWLALCIQAAGPILGIRTRVAGMEHLPTDPAQGAVLLVKHQSAYETFLMPALLPRPIAYVFKKELLKVPFFGWSIGSLDMIHIDRGHAARALIKVLKQGRRLLGQGRWVVMFPEGTRTPRGEHGKYMSSGARLAIDAGVPVVPVALNSGLFWGRKAILKKPGIITIEYLPPIPPGLDRKTFMRELESRIEGAADRLAAH